MQIEVPDELSEVFIQFLDLSQSAYTDEDIADMTDIEKQLFTFIEQLLGEGRVLRYKTKKDLNAAKKVFVTAVGRRM